MEIKYRLIEFRRMILRFFPKFQYYLAAKRIGDRGSDRKRLFQQLIHSSEGKKCLQIGIHKIKFAAHWISVDLYDPSPLIDYHYDVHDLKFDDEVFDIAVCNAVLEHVEDPLKAISELRRVLKKGGQIWVEVPFNQRYHPSPNDYWRVSLQGLKIWMKDFEEIDSGFFRLHYSSINNGVFFWGKK